MKQTNKQKGYGLTNVIACMHKFYIHHVHIKCNADDFFSHLNLIYISKLLNFYKHVKSFSASVKEYVTLDQFLSPHY